MASQAKPSVWSKDPGACLACGVRTTWWNLGAAAAMILLKVGVGVVAGSQALVASALYSLNDLLAAIAVLASLKVGGRPPDTEHPFGHGKVEYLAIGMVSVALAASVLMATYSIVDLLKGSEGPPGLLALLVALLSMGASLLLAGKAMCGARRLDSPALHTSAEHAHFDAVSSAAVAVGIVGAMLGLHWLDRVIAILEALDVMRLSGVLLGRALKGLMDTALPVAQVELVRRACEHTAGVLSVNSIRSRRSGREIWIDVIVVIEHDHTVEQAHDIVQRVQAVIRGALGPATHSQVAYRAATSTPSAEMVGSHV